MHEPVKAVRIQPKTFADAPRASAQIVKQQLTGNNLQSGRKPGKSGNVLDHAPRRLDVSTLTDLRRTPPPYLVERIRNLASFLPIEDRELVNAVYLEGKSMASIARMSGRSHKAVREHVRRIVTRILSPAFAYVALESENWPPRRKKVATLLFLHGLPLRPTAKKSGQTLHSVRKTYDAINEIVSNLNHQQFQARPGSIGRDDTSHDVRQAWSA
ncbi:MAG: sigma-70 family RNA polymerase sigma factor [Phycisphaeraceae bacterium]|nr:sigma-70 family RNA polymerase sigma factor [Phycisphaerales bacterium]MCB9859368.1 sigma-70 family RNA polymerase sigma factor [Phycisphaeraceae bacterium]